MNAASPFIAIDRAYDLRLLAAIPPTLSLFTPDALEAQLEQMAAQRRAICFTVMAPVATMPGDAPDIATVLVCLHVAPELAGRGVRALLHILNRTTGTAGDPIHEMAAPASPSRADAFYREAVYLESDASVTVTTHSPAYLPAETQQAVAAVTHGAAVGIVTTVAIAPWRPELAARLHADRAASTTLH
jgi:hypothetical protein